MTGTDASNQLSEREARNRRQVFEYLAGCGEPWEIGRAACWAHPSLTGEEIADAWDRYTQAVDRRDGLATGQLDWQSEYPELIGANCPNGSAQEEAVQISAEDADEALAVLVHGQKWGTR